MLHLSTDYKCRHLFCRLLHVRMQQLALFAIAGLEDPLSASHMPRRQPTLNILARCAGFVTYLREQCVNAILTLWQTIERSLVQRGVYQHTVTPSLAYTALINTLSHRFLFIATSAFLLSPWPRSDHVRGFAQHKLINQDLF